MPSIFFFFAFFLLIATFCAEQRFLTEQQIFENRIKTAETILFGRFHWLLPVEQLDEISHVYSSKQKTFEFLVYCTIKMKRTPNNVAHVLHVTIENDDVENDMKKNRWFVLFPRMTKHENLWTIENRTDAFDLEDEVKIHQFEQFCFLNPKLPFGFPLSGLLNRCPRPTAEHCLKNGTKIRPDELLELKTFLTSSTTKKFRTKRKSSTTTTTTEKTEIYIEPVW